MLLWQLPADTQEQETKAKRPKQKAAKYVVLDLRHFVIVRPMVTVVGEVFSPHIGNLICGLLELQTFQSFSLSDTFIFLHWLSDSFST